MTVTFKVAWMEGLELCAVIVASPKSRAIAIPPDVTSTMDKSEDDHTSDLSLAFVGVKVGVIRVEVPINKEVVLIERVRLLTG